MESSQKPSIQPLIGVVHVPDHYREWQGTAEELAQLVTHELSTSDVPIELNERLVRYYVTVGVLDQPTRRGKEAIFSLPHIVQLLVVRKLLSDRLSLSQIREVFRTIDWTQIDAITDLLPRPKSALPNDAERLVAQFKEATPASSQSALASPGIDHLLRSKRRQWSSGDLPSSTAFRPALRMALTPWIDMLVDPAKLRSLTNAQAVELGQSFAAELVAQRERMAGGKKCRLSAKDRWPAHSYWLDR